MRASARLTHVKQPTGTYTNLKQLLSTLTQPLFLRPPQHASPTLTTFRSVEVEQLQRVIESLTSDCESMKRQVSAEKECARNLEFIIKTGRQQEYDKQSTVEDKITRINHLEAKLQIKETELKEFQERYRGVCDDYDRLKEQNAKLLRNVTNERFERYVLKNCCFVGRSHF